MEEPQEHFQVPTFRLEELLNTGETRDIRKTQLVSSTINVPMGCVATNVLFY